MNYLRIGLQIPLQETEGFIATTDSYKLIKKIKNIFTFFVTLQHF